MRDFVAGLAAQPGGTPFHLGLVTGTAVLGYMDSLQTSDATASFGALFTQLSEWHPFCAIIPIRVKESWDATTLHAQPDVAQNGRSLRGSIL
jgi:hypothetical protein